ncbi:MAG: hypothetical protein K9L68_03890 [Spirochaetales bacterium]|nr:hypothetical protein [Spirochaetales bacterium]MCF7937720.1 hypothetical protein [Spirochaetales bacterium]
MSFENELRKAAKAGGGWFNAHAHIDRSFVMESRYVEHADMDPWEIATYPLEVKQHITGVLHEGLAYSRDSLKERISRGLDEAIAAGTRRLDSFIDVTADCVGLRALEAAKEVKEEYAGEIDFRIGAYPIFGFQDTEPERWEIFEAGSAIADFIGTLPERDARQGHIGFDEHFRRVLSLANERNSMETHFHVDQSNLPDEKGTERLIEAVRWLRPDRRGREEEREPSVWAVHSLSIASYSEARFRQIVAGLKETNIGVIVCPTASLSNKQHRNVLVPMHNSITRVLDLLTENIPVRIGTDNVQDFFLPAGSFDLYNEVYVAANALRFYNFSTWARVAAGNKPNQVDKMRMKNAVAN